MNPFILIVMFFLHVIDDFFIQSAGFLARGKQRDWWKKEAPDPLYRFDYIICLLIHGFSWAFMIMLPIAAYLKFQVPETFVIGLIVNSIVHSIIDDLKANRHAFNLITDQSLHIIQIIITYMNLKHLII